MKTFEEAKDQVAKEMFESSFREFEEVYYDDEVKMAELFTKAAELYARSMAAQAWEEGRNAKDAPNPNWRTECRETEDCDCREVCMYAALKVKPTNPYKP